MKIVRFLMKISLLCFLLGITNIANAVCWQRFDATLAKQMWRNNNMRIGQIKINNNLSSSILVELYHPDDPNGNVFAGWTVSPGSTYLSINNQRVNIGSDWGIRINHNCIDLIGSAFVFNNGVHQITLGNNVNNIPPQPRPPIQGNARENIEGGYGEIEATFYSGGRLVATTRAVSTSNVDGVHAAGFIVGTDQQGRKLFATPSFNIPTACSHMDFTCRTTTAVGSYEYETNPLIGQYVTRLEVYVTSRGDNSWGRVNHNIAQAVRTYNDLPEPVKQAIQAAAIAAITAP